MSGRVAVRSTDAEQDRHRHDGFPGETRIHFISLPLHIYIQLSVP